VRIYHRIPFILKLAKPHVGQIHVDRSGSRGKWPGIEQGHASISLFVAIMKINHGFFMAYINPDVMDCFIAREQDFEAVWARLSEES
jgi:hypothetical protein